MAALSTRNSCGRNNNFDEITDGGSERAHNSTAVHRRRSRHDRESWKECRRLPRPRPYPLIAPRALLSPLQFSSGVELLPPPPPSARRILGVRAGCGGGGGRGAVQEGRRIIHFSFQRADSRQRRRAGAPATDAAEGRNTSSQSDNRFSGQLIVGAPRGKSCSLSLPNSQNIFSCRE